MMLSRLVLKMNNEHDESIVELHSQPSFVFKPNENHSWRQQGPYAVCKSCEIMHATYIGSEVLIVGLDDQGRPLLKKR